MALRVTGDGVLVKSACFTLLADPVTTAGPTGSGAFAAMMLQLRLMGFAEHAALEKGSEIQGR